MSSEDQLNDTIRTNCERVKKAGLILSGLISEEKNAFLHALAKKISDQSEVIIHHNAKDLAKAHEDNLSSALIDRLTLNPKRIRTLVDTITEVAALPDPVGEITNGVRRPNGLLVYQERVPLGTVMVIFESRPNVIVDITSLAIKSGNAAILKGGKEALSTNTILSEIIKATLKEQGIPEDSIYLIETSEREEIKTYLQQSELIDVVIPRGGEQLISWVSTHSTIPVIKHDKGLCHLYVDELPSFNHSDEVTAFQNLIREVVVNSKIQKPGVCNAIETLLIHESYPHTADLLKTLAEKKVELRLDATLYEHMANSNTSAIQQYQKATDEDWNSEYLDLILSVKTVRNVEEAVEWINKYGSHHTDVILSKHHEHINYFKARVDSSCVVVNASSRFNDGGMLGLGAEVGISNQKLHVRGPMGIRDLTCLKYQVEGDGQTRN